MSNACSRATAAPAPAAQENTDAVLSEVLGLDAETLASLRADGVIA